MGELVHETVDDELVAVEVSLFINEYDERTGEYRGSDPPHKEDVPNLTKESQHWEDQWTDSTGDFSKEQRGLIKTIMCECGNKAWSGPRARSIRCRVCSRVHIDKEWEDDRYEKEDTGEDVGLSRWA